MVMQVTFLYELKEGACPKSYGTACARLAGMPEPILATAERFAALLEAACLTGAASAVPEQEGGAQQAGMPGDLLKDVSRCLSTGASTAGISDLLKLQARVKCAVA